MTRLDQNRAASQLAKKAGVPVGAVTNMTIWGNHSDTQYPDYKNAKIGGKPAPEVITDPPGSRRLHSDRRQARGGGDQVRGALVRRVGRQRRYRHRALGSRSRPPGRLVQRRGRLRRQLRYPRRPDLQLPARLRGERPWSIVHGTADRRRRPKRLDASAAD